MVSKTKFQSLLIEFLICPNRANYQIRPKGVKPIGKISQCCTQTRRDLWTHSTNADALHWFRVRTLGFLRESQVLSPVVVIPGIATLWLNSRVVSPKTPFFIAPSLGATPRSIASSIPFTKTVLLNLPDARAFCNRSLCRREGLLWRVSFLSPSSVYLSL